MSKIRSSPSYPHTPQARVGASASSTRPLDSHRPHQVPGSPGRGAATATAWVPVRTGHTPCLPVRSRAARNSRQARRPPHPSLPSAPPTPRRSPPPRGTAPGSPPARHAPPWSPCSRQGQRQHIERQRAAPLVAEPALHHQALLHQRLRGGIVGPMEMGQGRGRRQRRRPGPATARPPGHPRAVHAGQLAASVRCPTQYQKWADAWSGAGHHRPGGDRPASARRPTGCRAPPAPGHPGPRPLRRRLAIGKQHAAAPLPRAPGSRRRAGTGWRPPPTRRQPLRRVLAIISTS